MRERRSRYWDARQAVLAAAGCSLTPIDPENPPPNGSTIEFFSGEPRFHKGTIQTFTGRAYDFETPDPATLTLKDIGHHLSMACRWAGAPRRFYSVAEHLCRVSWILEAWGCRPEQVAYGFGHDFHEAYVWDCVRPLKPKLGAAYEYFADKADAAIVERYFNGVDPNVFHVGKVKEADDVALVAEARLLLPHPPEEWVDWHKYENLPPAPPECFRADAVGWPWELAEEAFHARAKELGICD